MRTDAGPVNQAVSEIVWVTAGGSGGSGGASGAAGGIGPGQFQEFPVLVERLPTDTDQAVFNTIQTYSDGTIVRWIDPAAVGQTQALPEHPTPILKLTASGKSGSSAAGTATVDVSKLAKKSSVSTATALGLTGIVFGALGPLVAFVAIRKRPTRELSATDGSSTP